VSTWSIAIAPNTYSEDEKDLNLKEAAVLTIGIGYLTMAVIDKLGLVLDTLASRGLRLVPAGQFNLVLSLAVGTVVALAILAALLRPAGTVGKAFPLVGVVLIVSGILNTLVA